MRRRVYDLWSSPQLRRFVRGVALVLVFGMLLANRPDCDRRQPNLTCDDLSINVSPGDCIDINNPCDPSGDFTRVDGFRLCDAPDGIFVRTNRSRSGTTRQVCASIDVAPLNNEPARFIYAAPGEFGEGGITITTGTQLEVEVAASASSVPPGGPVDLTSNVTGGTAPYTYTWSSDPVGQIGGAGTALPNPTVNPTVNVTFTLVVVDDDGNSGTDSVSVDVGLGLVVSPDVIIASGGSTQITAAASGGSGVYSYSWSPTEGLDDPVSDAPVASPTATTTYTVTVDDGAGGTASGQVTVTVAAALEAVASANPDTIESGQTSQLDVQTTGGDGNNTYAWLADDGLPGGSTSQSPQVSPLATTTYQVTVSDGLGQSVTVTTTVTVNTVVTGPSACFTWPGSPVPPTRFEDVTFDGTCSTPGTGETVTCVKWTALIFFDGDPAPYTIGGKGDCTNPTDPTGPSNPNNDPDAWLFPQFFGVEGDLEWIILEIWDSTSATDTQIETFNL